MLPKAELKGVYDKVVWLWNTRDFKGDERDRAAERVEIRFGMTTYPNLLLVDPGSEKLLAECARGPVRARGRAWEGALVPPRLDLGDARGARRGVAGSTGQGTVTIHEYAPIHTNRHSCRFV